MKRLTIPAHNRKLMGVCAGIAQYFEVDPEVVRVVMLAVTLITGVLPGVLFYIIAAIAIPKEGDRHA